MKQSMWLGALLALVMVTGCGKREVGGACSSEGDVSCDGTDAQWECKGGKWRRLTCSGPEGCKVKGAMLTCDNSKATVGDACDNDTYACSLDGTHLLKCNGTTFAVDEKCEGGQSCKVGSSAAGCE